MGCFTAKISPLVTIKPTMKPEGSLSATLAPLLRLTAHQQPYLILKANMEACIRITARWNALLRLSAYTSQLCPVGQIGPNSLLWDDGTELWLDDGRPVDYQ